jgi:hypothetical protein
MPAVLPIDANDLSDARDTAVILYSFECRKRADESLLGRIGPEVEAWPSAYDGSSQFLMF